MYDAFNAEPRSTAALDVQTENTRPKNLSFFYLKAPGHAILAKRNVTVATGQM